MVDIGVTNTTFISQATCFELLTGSNTVFANDGGVSRQGVDLTATLAGLISLTGTPTVFCEDTAVAAEGNPIVAHPSSTTCTGNHCVAFTGGSPNVFIG